MDIKRFIPALVCMVLTSCSVSNKSFSVATDSASKQKIESVIQHQVLPYPHATPGAKIDRISAQFLNTPYEANTLIGSNDTPEELVANLNGVDCFTFIDYVNALSHAENKSSFYNELIKTRYVDGKISFLKRKHFFTDWAWLQRINAKDVTKETGPGYQQITKQLNQKADGSEYISGLGVYKREISYIPGKEINQQTIDNLRTGDFIGVYTGLAGLDVTHVGIFIMTDSGPMFRNASSLKANNKVVDTPFVDYMKTKPGIIVLRPLD